MMDKLKSLANEAYYNKLAKLFKTKILFSPNGDQEHEA